MKFIRGILLALAIISSWLAVLVVAAPVHAFVFGRVPADGALNVNERIAHDRNISSYLLTGNEQDLNALQPIEVIHMRDVRQLYLWLVCMTVLFLALMIVTRAWQGAGFSVGLLAIVCLVSLAGFQFFFRLFHELAYSNDAWQLDPAQFLLTQIYPLGFFAWMWGIVGLCSLLTLFVLWQRARRA